MKSENLLKSLRHPCFNGNCGKHVRIHLPVAPDCNIRCNYCRRICDCVNESRPGVASRPLSPREALERYLTVKEELKKIDVAGIAGPGDALANFDAVKETFALIRKADSETLFCLSTNGLLLPRYAEDIAALGVSHVTVTVNAAAARTARRIYRSVQYDGKVYHAAEGAALLLQNQYEGIRLLNELGIVVKINTVFLKGINDDEISAIAARAKEAGADLCNIMQIIPVRGTLFEHIPMTSAAEIDSERKKCEAILPQMYHCRQCRADAVGTLDNDLSLKFSGCAKKRCAETAEAITADKPRRRFAVATRDGMTVNLHFGHTKEFYIYEIAGGKIEFAGKRDVSRYCFGKENCRHNEETLDGIVKALSDCDGVIALRIGCEPEKKLAEKEIRFFMSCGYVSEAVKEAACA